MFIDASAEPSALRQEGNVYRRQRRANPPSVRRAMFIDASAEPVRPPSGAQCGYSSVKNSKTYLGS